MKRILVYSDRGTSPKYVNAALETVKILFPTSEGRRVLAEELRTGQWEATTSAIVLPGGRDLPYVEELNGVGNQRIRNFVCNGGLYYGFCAGAYYAANRVCFEIGSPIEVTGHRELNFFPGAAIGSVCLPYDYDSNRGACLVSIRDKIADTEFHAYSNGGCAFAIDLSDKRSSAVEVQATYNDAVCARLGNGQILPAIVRIPVGRGLAILSGVHIELSVSDEDLADDNLRTYGRCTWNWNLNWVRKVMSSSKILILEMIMLFQPMFLLRLHVASFAVALGTRETRQNAEKLRLEMLQRMLGVRSTRNGH